MFFYITVLRALAAMLITNAHYTGVYPNDIVANGGLLGDIIFFTVSGYGLYNVKLNFPKWYAKRLYRIYLPVFLITITYLFAGFYSLSYHSPFWWFIYPTNYHFIASIAILYIPYYAIVSNKYMKEKLVTVRPSCYNCQFKGLKRASDFTVGDYWGVWNQYPSFNDNKGTTVVLVNSEKANRLWDEIAGNSKVLPIDLEHCMDDNPSAVESSMIDDRRECFFAEYDNTDFEVLIDRLLHRPVPKKADLQNELFQKERNW